MKYLSFLFLSFFMYAQQPYRDTLFMFNDKVYPCFVTDINESSIKFI